MYNSLERVLSYLIGTLAGAVAGLVLLRLHPGAESSYAIFATYALGIVSGLIGTLATLEYQQSAIETKNTIERKEVETLLTHEMRTALTSTGWALDLVLEKYIDHLTAGDAQLLKSIKNSIHATVMHSINLFDIDMLETAKLTINRQIISLGEMQSIFEESVERYKFNAAKKEIDFTATLTLDREMTAEVDPERLRMVLENLLENAVQYTVLPKKEIAVTITNDATYLKIIVQDSGIGIPKKEQAHIFQEFFRASNARKNLTNGSGIGLYTCLKYVTTHGGTIRFESEENKGTTFFVTIPLRTLDMETVIEKA